MSKNLMSKGYIACATVFLFSRAFYWELIPSSIAYALMLAGFAMLAFACIGKLPRDASFYHPTALWLVFTSVLFLSASVSGVFDGRLICMFFSVASIVLFAQLVDYSETMINALVVMLSVFALSTILFYVFPALYSRYVTFITGAYSSFPTDSLRNYSSGLTSHYSYNGAFNGWGFLLSSCMVMRKDRNTAFRYCWTAITAVFLFALVLTSKRSMLLFTIMAIIATYLLFGGKHRYRNAALLVLGGALIIAIAAAFLPGVASTVNRLLRTFNASSIDNALSGRIQLWTAAINGWLEKPLFGQGWGTYQYHWPNSDTVSVMAHNDFFHVLYCVGITGLALLLACMVVSGRVTKSSLVTYFSGFTGDVKWVVPVCFCVQFYSVLYGFTVGTLLVNPYVFQPFFMSIGLLQGVCRLSDQSSDGKSVESLNS